MNNRQLGWIILGGGLILSITGAVWIVRQGLQGLQPWSPLLSDNVIFAKALPFILGLGILIGLAHALLEKGVDSERWQDGRIRRFNTATIVNHWVNAIGFLLALVTGSVQYLVGVLDVPPPWPLYSFYRLHYIVE
jgi:cytochrome b subunit of formate dehydrogenase